MSSDIEDIALSLPCPACKAEPPYWCVTYRPTRRAPGAITAHLHAERLHPVQQAWSLGYHEGNRSALMDAAHHLRAARLDEFWARRRRTPPPILPDESVEQWLEAFAARWSR